MTKPEFDRTKISHVTNPGLGYALVNGCQGLFVCYVYWSYEEALERWKAEGGFDRGLDEQIVRVAVSILPDEGRPEEVSDEEALALAKAELGALQAENERLREALLDRCEVDMDDGFASPVTLQQFLEYAIEKYESVSTGMDTEMVLSAFAGIERDRQALNQGGEVSDE